jgi:hypothetical protein
MTNKFNIIDEKQVLATKRCLSMQGNTEFFLVPHNSLPVLQGFLFA